MRFRLCGRYEFVAPALSRDVEAIFGRPGTERQSASDAYPFESVEHIGKDILAVAVESFAGTELFDIVDILTRKSDDDSIAGSDDKLDSITVDACRTSSDEQSLTCWLRKCREELNSRLCLPEEIKPQAAVDTPSHFHL